MAFSPFLFQFLQGGMELNARHARNNQQVFFGFFWVPGYFLLVLVSGGYRFSFDFLNNNHLFLATADAQFFFHEGGGLECMVNVITLLPLVKEFENCEHDIGHVKRCGK
jgi:hypothetical protein